MLTSKAGRNVEEFQMSRFGISSSTCELSDDECPRAPPGRSGELQAEELSLLVA
jgi:hypothetical protein